MFLFLVLCSAFLQTSAEMSVPEEELAIEGSLVLDLKPQQLDSMIEQAIQENHLSLLVNFYAPWCAHCKRLASSFSELATELQTSVTLAKIDCVEHTEYCKEKHITQYPTLYFYHPHSGQKGEEYPGDTDGMMIRNWVAMHFAEPWLSLEEGETSEQKEDSNRSKVDAFVLQSKKENQLALIGYISDLTLLKLYKAWISQLFLSSKPNKFRFGIVSSPSSAHKANSIVLYTTFDQTMFETEFSKNVDLNVWLKNRELPLCGELTPRAFDSYKERKLPLVFVFLSKKLKKFEEWLEEIKLVAEENRGKFLFAWIDMEKHRDLAERLGVVTNVSPGIVITSVETRKHYPLHLEYSEATLRAHCKQFLEKKLPSLSRTQLQPSSDRLMQETTNGTGIKDVYANTWSDIVKDPTKNVLVFFDAHWCKECSLLRDKYPRVAQHFNNRSDVVIATIDVSANEGDFVVPDVLPGLTFYTMSNKVGIPYLGGRDLEELKFFLVQKLEEIERNAIKKSENLQNVEFPEHDEI